MNRMVHCVGKADRTDAELEALIEDIRSCDLLSGDSTLITKYEQALAQYFAVPHAISVTSGTAALHASLANIIQPGDQVLIPVIGVTMTASAVIMAGGVPVFYDCQVDSFKPDIASLEQHGGEKTRVLITVSMWGYPAIDDDIMAYARSQDWVVIEDAAQSFGTRNEDRYEGTKGDIGCFSTQEFKLLSTGEGGFILTENAAYAINIRQFTRLGFSETHKCFGYHTGLNYRLTALQASLGLSQLKIADKKIALRNQKVALWKDALGLSAVSDRVNHKLIEFNRDALSGYNGYALALRIVGAGEDCAKQVLENLFEVGVSTDIHRYKQSLLINYPFLKNYYAQQTNKVNPRVDFPNASKIMDGLITLPCHDIVSFDDIKWASAKVIDCLEGIL